MELRLLLLTQEKDDLPPGGLSLELRRVEPVAHLSLSRAKPVACPVLLRLLTRSLPEEISYWPLFPDV